MTTPAETAQRIREALEPYVRPREEVAHIRRVLRAHLAACLKSDDALDGSLALVDVSWDVTASPEARGLQRSYLRALQANLEARRALEQQCREATRWTATATAAATVRVAAEQPQIPPMTPAAAHRRTGSSAVRAPPTALEAHLMAARQARKRERLQVVLRYLDALGDKPAAREDFMRLDAIHAAATETLPPVPANVLEGLAQEEAERSTACVGDHAGAAAAPPPTTVAGVAAAAATVAGMDRLVAHVEKAVLRAQLLLRQEETRLAAAKTQASRVSKTTENPTEAKLRALEAARDELIAWMETELGNAAAAENGADGGGGDDDDDDDEGEEELKLLRHRLLEGGEDDHNPQTDAAPMQEALVAIRRKYAQYIDARRALVSSVEAMMRAEDGGAGSLVRGRTGSLLANMPHLPPPGERGAHSWLRTAAAPAAPPTTPKAVAVSTPDAADPKPVDPAVQTAAARGQLLLLPYLERLLAVAREQKGDIAHKAHYTAVLAKRQRETGQMLDHLADESQLLPRYPMPRRSGSGGGGGAKKRNVLASRDAPDGVSQRVAAWIYAAESAKIATFETVAEQLEEGQIALEKATGTLEEIDALLGRQRAEGEDSTQTEVGDIWATLNGQLGLLNEEGGRRRT